MSGKITDPFDIVRAGKLYPRQVSVKVVAPLGAGTIVKAGTPINAKGEVTNGSDAVGLLRYDVDTSIDQKGVLIREGVIDVKAAQEHSGVVYSGEVAAALPGVAMTGNGSAPGPGADAIATDEEVKEALDDLFRGHK